MDTAINERVVIGNNSKLTREELEAAFKQRTRDQRITENTPFDLRWQWEVWLSDLTPNAKLVAFAVRIFASQTGGDSRPSIDSLVQLTGLSRQTVVTQLKAIQKELLLTAERGKGRASSTYTLVVPQRTIAEISTVIDIRSGLPVRPLDDRSSLPDRPQSDSVAVHPLDQNDRSSLISDRSSLPIRPDITKDITTTLNRAASVVAVGIATAMGSMPVAAAQPPEPPAITQPVKLSLAEMTDRMMEAAGPALANPAAHAGLLTYGELQRWLAAGCDFEGDILSAIRSRSARAKPGSLKSWSYFADAVADQKAIRERPMPEGRAPLGRPMSWDDEQLDRRRRLKEALGRPKNG
jgi:hypothetical protein